MKSFSKEQLVACANGALRVGMPRLPADQMLMFDRVTDVAENGGDSGLGHVKAELDIHPGLWFFDCHFKGDPVMPGCLMLDALWQLCGFHLGVMGAQGVGRALGVGRVQLMAQVLPQTNCVTYEISVTEMTVGPHLSRIHANGMVRSDGKPACSASDLRVIVMNRKKK